MKHLVVLFSAVILTAVALPAQKLLAPLPAGGANGLGTILELDVNQQTVAPVYPFSWKNRVAGWPGFDIPLCEWNGKLYGLSSDEFWQKGAGIYAVDTATHACVIVHHFSDYYREVPQYGFTRWKNTLYGLTVWNCASTQPSGQSGGICAFDLATNQYSLAFCLPSDGAQTGMPRGRLTLLGNRLYGRASGGVGQKGYLFSWQPDSGIFRHEADFGAAGLQMGTNDLIALDSCLYGYTPDTLTGQNYFYQFNPATHQLTRKAALPLVGAAGTLAVLDGQIYGTTVPQMPDNGIIFRWDHLTGTISTLATIPGSYPIWRLNPVNHLLYAVSRGDSSKLLAWSPATGDFSLKHTFDPNLHGAGCNFLLPVGPSLYGVTHSSGNDGYSGTLFRWEVADSQYTHLLYLNEKERANPVGGLTWHQGKLYGIAPPGKTWREGSVFSWDPDSQRTTHHALLPPGFTGISGSLTSCNGLLYGICSTGGVDHHGTLFWVNPKSGEVQTCLSFDSLLVYGWQPFGSLTVMNGKLYGITRYGNNSLEKGTIFEYDPVTNIFINMYAFYYLSSDWASPKSNLFALQGKLYGFTENYLYEFDPVTAGFSILTTFSLGSCYWDNNKYLYGFSIKGGTKKMYKYNLVDKKIEKQIDIVNSQVYAQSSPIYVHDSIAYFFDRDFSSPDYMRLLAANLTTRKDTVLAYLCPPATAPVQWGCIDSMWQTFFVSADSTLAVEAPRVAAPRLRLVPNPARDRVNVWLDPALTHESLIISDMAGHAVLVAAEPGLHRAVETASLPAGVYLVRVGTASQLLVKNE